MNQMGDETTVVTEVNHAFKPEPNPNSHFTLTEEEKARAQRLGNINANPNTDEISSQYILGGAEVHFNDSTKVLSSQMSLWDSWLIKREAMDLNPEQFKGEIQLRDSRIWVRGTKDKEMSFDALGGLRENTEAGGRIWKGEDKQPFQNFLNFQVGKEIPGAEDGRPDASFM